MADSLSATSPGLVDVISGVLTENGPMTEDQLAVVLAGRGVNLGDAPDEALGDGNGLATLRGSITLLSPHSLAWRPRPTK